MSRNKALFVLDENWDTVATCSAMTVKYRKGNKSKILKECLQLIEETKQADAEYKKALYDLKIARAEAKETGGNTMISSVDEAHAIMQNYDFNKKVKDLRDWIQREIEWKKEDDTPELKQVNLFLVSKMEELLKKNNLQ